GAIGRRRGGVAKAEALLVHADCLNRLGAGAYAGISGEKMALRGRFYKSGLAGAAEKSIKSGSWPVARRKARRSAEAIVVVAVLTSGWKLTGASPASAASSTTRTRPSRSLIRPNGVTEPGVTPRHSSISSAEPKERRPDAPMRSCRRFRSIAVSSSATTRKIVPFLSLRNRFLLCNP